MKRYLLSLLVENKPGVLTRVTGLIARRGINIDSLAVGVSEDPTLSRITLALSTEETSVEQIAKQLHKLVNVVKITKLNPTNSVSSEFALYKVEAEPQKRAEIEATANLFKATVVDVGETTMMIEATGDEHKLERLEAVLEPYGIKEVARTGKIALARGAKD